MSLVKKIIEPCPLEELSVEGIRKRAATFRKWFDASKYGYFGYEAQAIEVLLAEIDRKPAQSDTEQGKEHG